MDRILKYRAHLMGFAIIGILICHFKLLTNAHHLFSLGSLGVEIFFFLSGIGLTLSYNKDSNPLHFYKKRILRIVPSYYITIACLLFLSLFWGETDYRMYSSFFIIGPWKWFLSLLSIFYLTFPLYMLISKKASPLLLFAVIVLGCLSALLLMLHFSPGHHQCHVIGRIPSFYIGCLLVQRPALIKKQLPWAMLAIASLAALFTCFHFNEELFKNIGIAWFLRAAFTPGFCLLLVAICRLCEKIHLHLVLKALAFLGGITLEIYLTEGYFSGAMYKSFDLVFQPLGWIPCIALAYAIHSVSKMIKTKVDTLSHSS